MVIKSPFNYTGSKHAILPQLLPLFPAPLMVLYDLFAGGGSVGVNAYSREVFFNDTNARQIGLLEHLYKTPARSFVEEVKGCISHYGLTDTAKYGYAHYGCDSSSGLASLNKEPYMALREDFNKSLREGSIDYARLYTLIVFAFNNQYRANAKGEFNSPVGKRDFNISMQNKLGQFMHHFQSKEAHFSTVDFRSFVPEATEQSLLYCDPPYLITTATYNEGNGWTDEDERDLLAYLDSFDAGGGRFGLSNVTHEAGKTNEILLGWLHERQYNVFPIKKTYHNSNYQKRSPSNSTREVFVTNYDPWFLSK